MSHVLSFELVEPVSDKVRKRAQQEGVTATQFVQELVARAVERQPDETVILAYNCMHADGESIVEREPDEDDESFSERTALYETIFGPGMR